MKSNHPQSAENHGRTAVLIPLRSLREGKLRLAPALSPEERAELIESMAERVVAAAHGLAVLIVHADPDVAEWAHQRGAMALRPDTPGLNYAVSTGCDHLRALGFERVIIAHADLPDAEDLRTLEVDHPVAMVPDRHGDGTNVLALDLGLDFTFAYGPGSFHAHCDVSRSLGIEPFIVDSPALSRDVDHPDDLPADEAQ